MTQRDGSLMSAPAALTFRYRVLIHEGDASSARIAKHTRYAAEIISLHAINRRGEILSATPPAQRAGAFSSRMRPRGIGHRQVMQQRRRAG
jgi:hypothetical protein